MQEVTVCRRGTLRTDSHELDLAMLFGILHAIMQLTSFRMALVSMLLVAPNASLFLKATRLAELRRGYMSKGLARLEGMIVQATGTECSEVLDKFFALVGIATDVDATFVDYRKDYRDLLIEVVLASIRKDDQPFLPCSYAATNRLAELPSWAVDFGINQAETHRSPLIP